MITDILLYLAIFIGAPVFALGYLLFFMEVAPVLAAAVRAAGRVIRLFFLTVGWVVVIVRLLL